MERLMKLGFVGRKFAAMMLVLAFASSATTSGSVYAQGQPASSTCATSPCSKSITITSYNGNDQSAISDLINGKISAYDFELTPVEASSLPNAYSKMSVPNSLYEVEVNPENTTWAAVSSVTQYAPNPFYFLQVRAALNYVLDRNYFVDNILGGAGVPILSVYGVAPDSLTVANGTARFQSYLTYNFALANSSIYGTLSQVHGMTYVDGHYLYEGKPLPVYLIDRTDDPFRSQYAGFLAAQLTDLGFDVVEEQMNLDLVHTTVMVENPVNATGGSPPTPWDIYIGSFSNVYLYYGDSLQVCFDGANCAAGPYSDNMTGDLAAGIWNTTAMTPPDVISLSDKLDKLNNEILAGTYTSLTQRTQILTQYAELEIEMGVNDWLATGLNVYGFNPAQVRGLTASITTSPILNIQSYLRMSSMSSSPLNLGVRYLTQFNMNPVGGYGDAYSADLLSGVFPGLAATGPGTGYSYPFGWTYGIVGNNSSATVPVPSSAINYNSITGKWYNVTSSGANLAVTVNIANLVKHTGYADGESVSLADWLYAYEIGKNITNPASTTYDASLGPTFSFVFNTILGFRILNSTSFTLYSNYYFFDPAQAVTTAVSSVVPYGRGEMPWTMYQAMNDLVVAKDDAYSAAEAAAKGFPQLTLIASGPNGSPTDISNLMTDLRTRAGQNYVPSSLVQLQTLTGISFDLTNTGNAFEDAANFLKTNDNGLISYGPFYVSTFEASTTPNYAVLTANPSYALTPYLLPKLFTQAAIISVSATVPPTVQVGSSISLTTLARIIGQSTAVLQPGADIIAQFVNNTSVVKQVKLTTGSFGTASLVIPASLTAGAYSLTLYASSTSSTIIIPETYSIEVLAVTPTSTSTTTMTSLNFSSTTASQGSSFSATDMAFAVIAAVVIIILVVVVMAKRRGLPMKSVPPPAPS